MNATKRIEQFLEGKDTLPNSTLEIDLLDTKEHNLPTRTTCVARFPANWLYEILYM